MKTTCILAIASTAMAAALPQAAAPATAPFRFAGLTPSPGNAIDGGSVEGQNGVLYIGKDTTTTCDAAKENCETFESELTNFRFTPGKFTLQLDAQVPGGQRVYVTGFDYTGKIPAGSLHYTKANQTGNVGLAVFEGFNITGGNLQFEGKGWKSCPLSASDQTAGWTILAASRAKANATCVDFIFQADELAADAPTAWAFL
ncbi:uncharacterized protein RCC_04323 [Ramularia collo-cygni]|uniref:Cell wall protein PhiA n=1 Tax=Ramularia collo-cygni TaxID=112498 RepID=A0A2D3UTV2_9PEZI|nr:uncharacterized protein RCC_04323 [Ramularia collo-cygni]CZT18478.1 uncharacterized protein RCC_04323 [Ramularia collo-cygni]